MPPFLRHRVRLAPSFRLIPSRFPPTGLFDRVAAAEDLEAVIAAESLTNDRLRDEVGEVSLVPTAERKVGPGATPIMAAFTHPSPEGSRFSDGSFGVYYAGALLQTAVRETVYHRERWLAASEEPPMTLEMRLYRATVDAELRDLRGAVDTGSLLDPNSYATSQPFGVSERHGGGAGIIYPSVRDPEGECVAAFTPNALGPARASAHYGYVWDGAQITSVFKMQSSGVSPHA